MPTSLDRIQCLMQPDTYAKVMTLVNVTGKTKSNMAAELIEAALLMPKYKNLMEEADEAQAVTPKEDPRTESRQRSFHRQPSAAVKDEAKRKASYMELIPEKERTMVETTGIDQLTPERLRELQKLLQLMEALKQ